MSRMIVVAGCINTLLILATTDLMAIPFAGGAGEITPRIGVELGQDSNVDLVERGETDDTFLTISPQVYITGETKFTDFSFNYRLEASKFAQTDDNDELKHFFNANASRPVSSRQTLSARANINLDTEDITNVNGGTLDNDFSEVGLGLTWQIGQADAPFGFSTLVDITSRDSDLGDDSGSARLGGEFRWALGPKSDAEFKASRKRINESEDNFLTGAQNDLSVGVTWRVLSKTSGRAFVGQSRRTFDDQNRSSNDALNFEFALDWLPVESSTVTLSAVRVLRDAELVDGFSTITSLSYGVSWRHELTDLLSFSANLNRTEDDFVDPTIAEDERTEDINSASLSLSRLVSAQGRATLTARHETKESSRENSDYTRNLISTRYDYAF